MSFRIDTNQGPDFMQVAEIEDVQRFRDEARAPLQPRAVENLSPSEVSFLRRGLIISAAAVAAVVGFEAYTGHIDNRMPPEDAPMQSIQMPMHS